MPPRRRLRCDASTRRRGRIAPRKGYSRRRLEQDQRLKLWLLTGRLCVETLAPRSRVPIKRSFAPPPWISRPAIVAETTSELKRPAGHETDGPLWSSPGREGQDAEGFSSSAPVGVVSVSVSAAPARVSPDGRSSAVCVVDDSGPESLEMASVVRSGPTPSAPAA